MTEHVRASDLARDLMDGTPEGAVPCGVSVDDALRDLVGRMERGEPVIQTLRTGIALFDETSGGLVRGEYAGLAAGPGVGKSLLADRVTLGVLRQHPEAKALIFNLETATLVRVARLLCGAAVRIDDMNAIAACLPLGPLLRGELEPGGITYARECARTFTAEIGGRLRFMDNVCNACEIASTIRTARPEVVVVDHFGLVTADWLGSSASAVDRLDQGLHEVYAALRDVNAAGILIAELTKSALVSGTADIGSIRGSARFASLAGQQLTMLRTHAEEGGDQHLRIELHKNRHGRPMVAQQATLYGGLGYLHFGSTAPLMAKARRQNSRKKKEEDADERT